MPKGRQVGITWLELAAMLWAGTFFSHRLFPIARQSDEYAREAITRLLILAGYDPTSEPGKLRVLPESPLPRQWRPRISGKTRRELQLGQRLGLSRPDRDPAHRPWSGGLLGAGRRVRLLALAGPPAGGHGVGLCPAAHRLTGNGADDAFAALYENAAAGRGAYRTLFIGSDADPRRNEEWYRTQRHRGGRSRERPARTRPLRRRCLPLSGGRFLQALPGRAPRHGSCDRGNWQTWRAIDFGYRHPACLWAQRSPAGQLFIVDELLPENTTTPEFVAQIKAREGSFGLAVPVISSFCDPAGKAANVQTAESEFAVFAREGLRPCRAELRGA